MSTDTGRLLGRLLGVSCTGVEDTSDGTGTSTQLRETLHGSAFCEFNSASSSSSTRCLLDSLLVGLDFQPFHRRAFGIVSTFGDSALKQDLVVQGNHRRIEIARVVGLVRPTTERPTPHSDTAF